MSTGQNGDGADDPTKRYPFYPPEYWMITERWREKIEESKVDPGSQGRTFIQVRELTRAIACHPLAHHVAGLANGLSGYVIISQVPITKKLFDWWVMMTTPPEKKEIDEIATKIESEKGGGSLLV